MGYNIFISYRRAGAAELGQLLYTRLSMDGYKPFFDVETMRSGKFNHQLYERIEECPDFLLLLPMGSLNPRDNEEDWVRLEIEHALKHHKNIVPVFMRNFQWPDQLHETITDIKLCHGVTADMDYFDAVYNKIKTLLITQPQITEKEDITAQFLHVAQRMLNSSDFENAQINYNKVLEMNPSCAQAYLGLLMVQYRLRDREMLREYYANNLIWDHSMIKLAKEFADGDTKQYLDSLSPPTCSVHNNVAVHRCDYCGTLLCDDCRTFVNEVSTDPPPWVSGKMLCPECSRLLRTHSISMIRGNLSRILGKLLFLCILAGISLFVGYKNEISAVVVAAIGGAIIWQTNSSREHNDGEIIELVLRFIFLAIFGVFFIAYFLVKQVYYLIRILQQRKIIRGSDMTFEQLIDVYYRLVKITRGMGRKEPDWPEMKL